MAQCNICTTRKCIVTLAGAISLNRVIRVLPRPTRAKILFMFRG